MDPREDARIIYADIIDLPHHRSAQYAPMSPEERAAQFSAYDALAGYYDMIAEEERLTDREIALDENALELLDRELAGIAERLEAGERPRVRFTVFVPDPRKDGGSYEQITDRVRQIDGANHRLVLESRTGRGGRRRTLEIASITALQTAEGDE